MLIRHSIIYIAARALPSLLNMATTVILTRVLSPSEYGLYGLSLVVMTFGSGACFDWALLCLTRFYQGRRGDTMVLSTVFHFFAANVVLTAMVFALVWYVALRHNSEAPIYAIGMLMMWCYAWFELGGCIEIVSLLPKAYFAMNLGRAVFVLVFALGAAKLTHDPIWTASGTALGMFVGSWLRQTPIPRLGPSNFDLGLAREMLAFGLPLAVAMVVGGASITGTRAMVEWLGSPEALGYYTAAFVLIQNTLAVLSTGIGPASYQLAVRAVESGDRADIHRQLLDNITFLLAVMAPAALGVALTAKGIATTLVGAQYADAVANLTPFLAASAFFSTIRACYLDHAFQLGRRPYLLLRVLSLTAAVALALSYWLIPRYGPQGAAIAAAVSAALGCAFARIEGAAAFPLPLPLAATAKILAACGVMTIGVLSIKGGTTADFVLQVIVGGALYSFSALALNILDIRERIFDHLPRRLPWRAPTR